MGDPRPVTNTDEFLNLILGEIRGLRQDLQKGKPPKQDSDMVQLKEPKRNKKPQKKGR